MIFFYSYLQKTAKVIQSNQKLSSHNKIIIRHGYKFLISSQQFS